MNMKPYTLPIIIGILFLLFILPGIMFIADQRQIVVQLQFGEIIRVIDKPGLYFKWPFVQDVKKFDRRLLTLDTATAETYLTSEKKPMLVNSFVKWRIKDVGLYYRSFGGNVELANNRLSQRVNSDLREAFGQRTVQEVVSGERDKIMLAVRDSADRDARSAGIEVVDVRLKRVDLPEKVGQSVFERMRAERKRVANELRSEGAATSEKIRAEADRDREIVIAKAYKEAQRIKGEGDAKATAIYARAFQSNPEFYAFYRSLEAYDKSFKNNSTIVLDPAGGSSFFKYFRQGSAQGK